MKARAAGGAYKRPNFPTEFKRRLVEQSFEPGASVALIARANEVNANLLFKWRRQYLQGAYGIPSLPDPTISDLARESAPLLPVSIVADTTGSTPAMVDDAGAVVENVCEVVFSNACLRIRGEVSPQTLRLLIRELSR
ncbi:transposase [Paraburkholderia sediminicola]|uniref:IS66-like element accessory protein TnpA n=1 Tax=Paraburkholderia sediminicola TaxID=458836 RepID=UPI0038BB20AF